VLRAWTAWNSAVHGAIADFDPITGDDSRFVGDEQDLYCEVPLPEIVHPILGSAARLRLTISRRD
jgi:hypothetical protein